MSIKKWYNNGVEERLIDVDAEMIPNGYFIGRLKKPKKSELLKQKISKSELFDFYIIQNNDYFATCLHFNIERYELRLLLNEYEITKSHTMSRQNNHYKRTHEQSISIGKKSSLTQKKNWEYKSDKEKLLWKNKCKEIEENLPQEIKDRKTNKYISWLNSLSDAERDKINKKRSESCKIAWEDPELIEKQHKTYLENKKNRKCRSVAEQKIYDSLIKIYPDLRYDVKVDNRYPYFCDFYIPSLDLFIEFQGHPSHGTRPYNKCDVKSLEESYKLYGEWFDIYTNRDVKKYETAEMNNINYIRIYPFSSLEENIEFNNNKFNDIISIILNETKSIRHYSPSRSNDS